MKAAWARCWPTLLLGVACGTSSPGPAEPASSAGSSNAGVAGSSGSATTVAGSSSSGSAGLAGATAVGGAGAGGQPSTAGTAGTGGGVAGAGGQPNSDKPPEGVPQTYKLVYSQTFAEASSLGDLALANPTEWKHDPAGFVETTGFSYKPPFRSPFTVAIVKAIQVKSFVLDAELWQTSPDGDGHRDMVLIWTFVNPSQFYYAHISTAHDGVAHNIHIVNNADRMAISTSFTAGYDWGRDVWKRFRLVRDAVSGSMAIYDLDGAATPILEAKDTTFSEGYVGFGSFDNTGKIRNVKVWAESSTPGNPAFF